MKLDIQYFASASIDSAVNKIYTIDDTTGLINNVGVVITPINEGTDFENNYSMTDPTGWTKLNDGNGSYYKDYTSNTTETLTFKWYDQNASTTSYLFSEQTIKIFEIGTTDVSYTPTEWENSKTKLNAANMNHIEEGIKKLNDYITPKSLTYQYNSTTEQTELIDRNTKEVISVAGSGGSVSGDTLPIGSVVDYSGTTVPSGWEEITSGKQYEEYELFYNSDGITASGALNDAVSNYKRLGCYAFTPDGGLYCEIDLNVTDTAEFKSFYADSNNLLVKYSRYKFSGTNISRDAMWNKYVLEVNPAQTSFDNTNENGIKLYKVVGYKEV